MSTAIGAGISGVFGEKPGSGVSAYDNIYSVHFDSPAQRINCGDSSSFSFPGTVASDRAFSISTWVYFVDTVESVRICGKGDVGTADAEYNLETDPDGRVRIRLYDSTVSSTSTSYWQGRNNAYLETNKWYHIVATFDGTTPNAQSNSIRIYVNNQLNNVVNRINTGGDFVQMHDNGGKFILGTTDGVNSKNIYMDEAAIFNRALTQADINYLYSIPFTPNLTVNGNFTELGSELILNGDFDELGDNVLIGNNSTFDSGIGDWQAYNGAAGASVAHSTDKLEVTLSSSEGGARINTNSLFTGGQAGKILKIRARIWKGTSTAPTIAIYVGGVQKFVTISSTPTYFEVYLKPTGTGYLTIYRAGTGSTGTYFIDDVSVQQVDPNNRWTLNASGDSSALITDKLTLSCDDGDFVNAAQNYSFVNGNTYRVSFDLTGDNQSKSFTFRDNSSALGGLTEDISLDFEGTETKTFIFTANANSDVIYLKRNSPGTYSWSIDNVSLKDISGWTFGDGWSVNSSNQAEYDGTGTTASALEQTVATYEDGKKYQVQFQLDGSLNGVSVSINGGTAVNSLRSTTDNSSRSVTVIAGSGSNSLKITPLDATDTFTIYDITSKLVTSLAAPNTDKDDARAIDLTGMSDLDHWWRMGDIQGPATYPVIHDVVYNPFGDQLVENGNFDELGPQLIQNPYFNLGPELVDNGDFATDSDWNNSVGNYWVISNGVATLPTTSTSNLNQAIGLVQNKFYKIVFTIANTTLGGVRVRLGTGTITSEFTNGTHTIYLEQTTTNDAFRFYADSSGVFNGSIDNVSVKEIPHWSLQEGWSIENGFAVQDGTNTSYSSIQSDDPTTPTKTYKVSIDIDEVSGPVELKGSGVYTRLDTLGVGSHVVYITADASYIRVLAFAGSKIKFKDFFVEQVDPEGEWTKATGWSISGGLANANTTAYRTLAQNIPITLGEKYKVVFDVVSITSGSVSMTLGADSGILRDEVGTYSEIIEYNNFYSSSGVRSGAFGFVGSIDNVSVQQVSDTSGIMENMKPDNIVAFSPPDPDPLVGDEFIFSVNTAYTGTGVSNADQFQLPLISAGTLDFTVIWGDGTQDIITSYNQAETLHTYPSSGTYTIGIRANTQPLKGFKFDNGGDKLKMSNIVNWGGSNFRLDRQEAFYGCSNMTCTATDAPLITVTIFYRMFRGCSNFNGDLSNWDVRNVTSFNQMFYSNTVFTGKGLENWDISSADKIESMFFNCPVFNGQIGGWDTTGVINMRYMFQQCGIFNQDISSWDTSLVTRMNNMFQEASEFNQPLNSWDVSSCVDFTSMFKNAIKFNQPLNNWTIKNDADVNMNAMFFNANAFNQDVSMWDVSRVRYMHYMFYSCRDMSFGFDGWDTSSVYNFYRFAGDTNFLDTSFGYLDMSSAIDIGLFKNGGQTISTENYNNTLIGWAAQTVNPDLTTSFGSATYSYSAFDARNTLTSAPNNWVITDGGYVPTDNAFQFTVNPNLQTLGSDLVTDGDFALTGTQAADTTGTYWTTGQGWTISNNVATVTNIADHQLKQTLSFVDGFTYKISFEITEITQGSLRVFLRDGGQQGFVGGTYNTTGVKEFVVKATTTSDTFTIYPSGTTTASVTNISVKEVLSDTNQFELPLINSGTQDFVVDWGDGEQDKITAWDDAAKRHSYYTYGSEEVTNGDFSDGKDDWTEQLNVNFSVTNGVATIQATQANSLIYQNLSTNISSTLRVEIDVVSYTGSHYTVQFGGSSHTLTDTGKVVFYTDETRSNNKLDLAPVPNATLVINSVSVVEQTPDTTPKTISIDGTIQGWQFNAPGDYLKLNNINRWGALDIHNNAMFFRCANMTCTATDAPVVTTTMFYRMFRGCSNFNGPIGNWDVSGVTRIDECFKGCSTFNQPLNSWDVSNINVFAQAFNGCANFVQDLNDWQINNSEIVNMYAMFYNCFNFNGDIYSWDTSKVWNMSLMFYNCQRFDQSLAAWNIESVTNFGDVNLGFMRLAAGLSTSNYNLTLVSWAHQNVNSGLEVDFGGSQYSAGGAAAASRNILTSAPNNWIISDGGSV